MIIGVSLNSGANATFSPSLVPCRSVCVITSVSIGPDENPAGSPKPIQRVTKRSRKFSL